MRRWDGDADACARRFPRLHHLAHADAWPSLREHGLLSAEALVRRSSLGAAEQDELLVHRRARSVLLPVPGSASVVLRDQGPLSETKLAGCLTGGTTPAEWIALLNSMVFLFPARAGLDAMLAKYGSDPVLLLQLDTASVVAAHGERIRLAPINTGSTIRLPARRGPGTFAGIGAFDRSRPVREVALPDGLPDLDRHLVRVDLRSPDGALTPLR